MAVVIMDHVHNSGRAGTGFVWARAMALVSLVFVIGSVSAASGSVEISDFSKSSLVLANDNLAVLDSFEIPDYAVIVHESDPRSCVDGSPLPGGPFKAAIWNPPEILEQVRPYALEISEDLLSRLAGSDVAAAYVVGLRLPAVGQVVVGPDMHQGEFRLRESLGEKSMLEWIASAGQSELAFEPLPDGREFWIRYRTEFDDVNDWRLVVESWISDAAQPTLIELRHTELRIDSVPSTQLPVEASGGYLAPVYRVQGFRSEID